MKERKSQLNKSRILWLIDYLNSSTCKIEVSTDYFCLFMFLATVSVRMVFNVSFSTKEKGIVYLLKKNLEQFQRLLKQTCLPSTIVAEHQNNKSQTFQNEVKLPSLMMKMLLLVVTCMLTFARTQGLSSMVNLSQQSLQSRDLIAKEIVVLVSSTFQGALKIQLVQKLSLVVETTTPAGSYSDFDPHSMKYDH